MPTPDESTASGRRSPPSQDVRPSDRRTGRQRRVLAAFGVCIALSLLPETGDGTGNAESDVGDAGIEGEESPVDLFEQGDDLELALQPWTGDYDGMVERRMVRILVPYSTTHFFLDGAAQRGVVAAAGRELQREINRREGLRVRQVHVVFIPVSRSEQIPWLMAGLGDIAAGDIAVTDRRRTQVDFSVPVFRNAREVVVTGPGAPPIASLEDLSGREVFVHESSSYDESLNALNRTFEAKGLAPIQIEAIDELLEPDELLELVADGSIPITVAHAHMADFWAEILTDLTVHSDLVVAGGRDIAWAFRQDSPKLAKVLRDTIAPRRHRTEFGNVIFKRYLRNTRRVQNPSTTANQARYDAVMPHFRKFGEEHDVDPLLLAALAYQESGLDQSARSPAGAIGVMQLLPTTAASLNVGDITRLEPNIHGGTRYFRQLLDGVAGPDVDPLNQVFFALASYNAGQTRIRALRRETARRGLDPNVWLHNVELAVARDIGRETVQYVHNVYRFHLVYRRIEAERARRGERRMDR